MKVGRKPEYPEKTPDDELQKVTHAHTHTHTHTHSLSLSLSLSLSFSLSLSLSIRTPMPEDSSPNRDSNPHSSIGGRLGKQMCYPLHHASPRVLLYLIGESVQHSGILTCNIDSLPDTEYRERPKVRTVPIAVKQDLIRYKQRVLTLTPREIRHSL